VLFLYREQNDGLLTDGWMEIMNEHNGGGCDSRSRLE
jgi:hypothetical protein